MEIVGSVIGSAFGASVTGSSHVARGKPNQDSAAWRQKHLWTYVAVADGHGGAPHYRSDRGSRFAVSALMDLFRDLTDDGRRRHSMALAHGIGHFADQIVARWRAMVEADLATDPIGEPAGFASFKVYGSTCLGAAIGPGVSVMIQLGDGDLFVGLPDGSVDRPFVPDELVGEQTYSICLPDAASHLKIGLFTPPHEFSVPDFLIVSTDGLGKSFQTDGDFRAVIAKTFAGVRDRGPAEVQAGLAGWLSECSRMGSGDDTSVAIFCAPDHTIESGAGPAVGAGAADIDAAAPARVLPAEQPGSPRRLSPATVTTIALIVGFAAGALLSSRVTAIFVHPAVTSAPIEMPPQTVPPELPPLPDRPTSPTKPARVEAPPQSPKSSSPEASPQLPMPGTPPSKPASSEEAPQEPKLPAPKTAPHRHVPKRAPSKPAPQPSESATEEPPQSTGAPNSPKSKD